MAKDKDYKGLPPEELFVVMWNNTYRIYRSEGQANNWLYKKTQEGYKAIKRIYVFQEFE